MPETFRTAATIGSRGRPTTRELVLVPAIITLAITALRLVGELQGWDQRLFNRAGGGGGAIIGISWLPLFFGVYFAWRLVRAGEGPARAGKALGMAVVGLLIFPAAMWIASTLGVPQLGMIVVACFVALVAGTVACQGWPELGKTLFVYALAARVPVAVLMLPAILGHWGTHYDALPPKFPAMSPVATWAVVGLFPQMTLWIGLTLVMGMLTGSITAAVLRGRRHDAVPVPA
jgi:hypothetical protein